MSFSSNRSAMQAKLGLTDDDISDIVKWLPHKNYYEYISHKTYCVNKKYVTKQFLEHFLARYLMIKDDSWPALQTLDDFDLLSEDIKKECIEYHKFSPEIWLDVNKSFSEWVPTPEFNYDPDVLIRVKNVLLNNKSYIENQNVLDFPCSYGNLSIMVANLNPRSLIMADIRQEILGIANEGVQLVAGNNLDCKTVLADIHDYKSNHNLCLGRETVLICGLMYHVNDHYPILESIASAGPNTIIIETQESPKIQDSPEPLIWFCQEDTEYFLNGWEKDKSKILVGFPNEAWLDLSMQMLGYRKVKPCSRFDCWGAGGFSAETGMSHRRAVHVYGK